MKISEDNCVSPQPSLRKILGLPDGIAILIGIMIGAGIYSTPQIIAGYLGSFNSVFLFWIIAGIFVFSSGLIYAELGTRLPATGGEYVYVSQCFGPFAGFMFGWAQLFIIRTSAAAGLAIIIANYLGYFIKLSGTTHTLLALAVIALFGLLNYIGIQWACLFQKISTVIKVGGLFTLVMLGLILVQGQESLLADKAVPTAGLGPAGNAVAAFFLIIFSFTGWERLGYVAGEMKNPRRTIPLSLTLGIGIIVILYVFTNMIYHRTLGMEGMRTSTIVASDVVSQLIGPIGAALISILVVISASGSINGTIITAPRSYYAMAKDGLFFKWLDYIHPRFRTPSRAILAHCVWSAVILLTRKTFETIASGLVFAILIFYALTALSLFKLRKKDPDKKDIFRVPFYPILPGLYFTGILLLLVLRAVVEWQKSLIDLAFIASGLPFSIIWCRKRGRHKKQLESD